MRLEGSGGGGLSLLFLSRVSPNFLISCLNSPQRRKTKLRCKFAMSGNVIVGLMLKCSCTDFNEVVRNSFCLLVCLFSCFLNCLCVAPKQCDVLINSLWVE